MRRKMKLYALTAAALTVVSGLGNRTLAAVPPKTKMLYPDDYEGPRPEASVSLELTGNEMEESDLSQEAEAEETSPGTCFGNASDSTAGQKKEETASEADGMPKTAERPTIRVVIHGIPETGVPDQSAVGIKKETTDQKNRTQEMAAAAVESAGTVEMAKKKDPTITPTEAIGKAKAANPQNRQNEDAPDERTAQNGSRDTEDPGDTIIIEQYEEVSEERKKTDKKPDAETNTAPKNEEKKKEPEKAARKDSPRIRIDGIRNRAVSRSPVDLSAHITDRDGAAADVQAVIKDAESGKVLEGKVTKNPEGYQVTFPKIGDDGHYQVTVQTKDEQGKVSSEKKVAFTVNQHGGAAYLATENLAGKRVNRPVRPEFIIADVDESAGLRLTVNGRQVEASYNKEGRLVSDQVMTKEGRYVVRVEGKDSAGHEIKSRPVEFVIDKTKPRVWLKTKATDKGLMVEVFHDIPEDRIESVVVDDKVLKGEDYTDQDGKNRFVLKKEGSHTVKVTVRDAAGNKTERTQSLRVAAGHAARKKTGHVKTVYAALTACSAGILLLVFSVLRRRAEQ